MLPLSKAKRIYRLEMADIKWRQKYTKYFEHNARMPKILQNAFTGIYAELLNLGVIKPWGEPWENSSGNFLKAIDDRYDFPSDLYDDEIF